MILADSTKFENSGVISLFLLTEAKMLKSHQELHDDGAQKMCGSTMGVSDQAFFLYERPRNKQRLQTSAFSHRRNQDGRAEKYNLRWKEIHFLDFCILLVQQVFNWGSLWLMVWQQAQLSKSCMPAAREASFKPTQLLRAAVGYTEECDDNVSRYKLN